MEAASDEYLTALANKGIVKRAYKDKETVDAVFLSENEDAPQLVWQIGGEQVTLVEPLAESRCSCPSRSICRHVILGIRAARERFAAEAGAPVPAKGCGKEQESREPSVKRADMEARKEQKKASGQGEMREVPTEKRKASEKGEEKEVPNKEREASEKGEEKEASTEKREASEQGEEKGAFNEKREALEQGEEKGTPKRKQKASEQGEERAAAGESRGQAAAQTASDGKRNAAPVWGEIASYPLSELRRVLGIKKIRALLQQRRSGVNPVISGEQVDRKSVV